MKSNRKYLVKLFSFLSIFTITPAIVLATSCLSDQFYAETNISSVKDVFPEKLRNQITNLIDQDQQTKERVHSQRIIQITAAGKVNDNSFNQLAWEAISEFSRNVKTNQSSYKQTATVSSSEIHKAYSNALHKNFNIWVLIGWQHATFLASWLKNPINKAMFEQKEIKVVAVDWDVSKIVNPGSGLSLTFRTQESSFLIGYSVAQFLGKKYKGSDQGNQSKRIINTSAGTDTSGSTNFNYGFLEGIRTWNDNPETPNDEKIFANVYKEQEKVFLNTTYTPDNLLTKSDFRLSITGNGEYIFKGPKPSIVMPVAGDWSRTAANIIKETNNLNQQWVVGVDSNMAISYGPAYKDYFITSSEKRIGIAVYKALCFLTGISNQINNPLLFPDSSQTNWTVLGEKGTIGKIHQTDSSTPINQSVIGGIDLGFVDASPSTIQNQDEAQRFDQIVVETKNKFFGSGGKLQNDLKNKVEQVNQYEETLKALEDNPTAENRKKFNEAVFHLNNILKGEMNSLNNDYFNLIINEINKR